ncbi:solute carrier family 2, facilitated glucose transporter member 3 isoform X2 [Magallana gigas]|uniref:solute carrier family 2, facilitated glucose transporter member 3 isoform X2 n=1 Tax=Magallana gigas TaxID=29159 RepID=UPI003342D14B
MEKQPLLGFRRGIHNSENTEEKQTLITGAHDADVTVATERHYTKNLAFAIAACVCGSSFMLGYNTGVVNTPATIIKDFYNASYNKRQGTNSSKYLSTISISVLWATTVSVFALGGMIGGLSAGYWCNKYGRKGALLRNNLLHLLSAALMYYSNFINSYEMLIAGRLLVGICAGAAPLYLMEIAPTSLRGFAGVFNQLAINIGILVSQILGLDSVMGTKDLWPCDLGATVVPIVIMLCSLPWCPESPRFLMLTAMDENKAEKALIWLRETEDVGEDMDEMKREAETQTRMPEFAFMDLFRNKFFREPLTISVVLQLTQQFSGINAVIYYSTEIFKTAGLSAHWAEYATIATGGVNVVMTLVSAFLMDRVGRRTLLLVGVGGLLIFSAILALSLILIKELNITVVWLPYLAIVSVICYIIAFASGPGSIPWFMVAEIFSQGPRSAAISVSTMVNWFSNFTVGLVFPLLNELAIHQYSFLPFVVLLIIFLNFIYRRVPETKGKTFEQISLLFRRPDMMVYESIIQQDSINTA